MKVKEEDLRRELLKAINGEDLIINCARRLGIRLNNFKCRLYTARIHGIESVLHSNRLGGYSDELKLEVVDSLMKDYQICRRKYVQHYEVDLEQFLNS